jgi:transcriptional regulator with XRE-family HTH domain
MPEGDRVDWRQWMHALGGQGRRAREFLGLSQEQLAALAGVSQGSVSRFEAGRGLATPMLVVVKIHLALMRELRRIDPDVLSDRLKRLLEFESYLSPALSGTAFEPLPPTRDPDLTEIVRLYQSVSDRQRGTLLTVVRATMAALGTQTDAVAAPRVA